MSFEINKEVVNVDAVIARLSSLGEIIQGIAVIAATEEAEYELPMTRAQVPIGITGQLRLSGHVTPPDFEADTLTAGIEYGGPPGAGMNDEQVDYALIVHEDMALKHPVGKAKYVEDVVRAELDSGRAGARMSATINRLLDESGLFE